MRTQIYKAICERLKEKTPDVAYINLWNNNIAVLAGDALWPRPAVFVEFETIEWRQLQQGVRRGDVAVRLHIITDHISTDGSDDERQEQALAYFDLIDRINAAMQGLRGENFAGFMLTSSATNHDHAELIESVERYLTSAQDITAMPQHQRAAISALTIKA